MKKFTLLLVALSIILSSCSKDDDSTVTSETPSTSSFSMTFDGQTYNNAKTETLVLIGGNINVVSETDGEFWLLISGVGADGTTTNICTDIATCGDNMCTVTLTLGENGSDGLVATSGTVKRTGNKIEVNILGINIANSTVDDPLTAVIEVESIIAY